MSLATMSLAIIVPRDKFYNRLKQKKSIIIQIRDLHCLLRLVFFSDYISSFHVKYYPLFLAFFLPSHNIKEPTRIFRPFTFTFSANYFRLFCHSTNSVQSWHWIKMQELRPNVFSSSVFKYRGRISFKKR